jgi:glutamate formiminotransferase
MQLLTVPNWSFGRNRALRQRFDSILEASDVVVHYHRADIDHNRTVTAFSGPADAVFGAVLDLAEAAFEAVDLNRHLGVHPRIGALDVCPFVMLESSAQPPLDVVEEFARELARLHELPVFLYEQSEKGRHEADLPTLRKGGFGSLLERELRPDFGPSRAHRRLGVSVVGLRGWLLAVNVNLREPQYRVAKEIASQIRKLRQEGDPRFLGVRALGLRLASRELSQVSMNLTLPDLTPVDPIVAWIREQAAIRLAGVAGTELIGVIRPSDLAGATSLRVAPEQVVSDIS